MIDKSEIQVSEDTQLVFNIPEENMDALKAKLAKLSKKAEKAGYPPVFIMPIGFKDDRGPGNYVHRTWEVLISGIAPKHEGWNFNARIDYSRDSGNVIYVAPGRKIPEKYKTIDSVCEHCNRKRVRRTGYLLQNEETGEYKVVGSTCIEDFFGGHTPESLAKYFETLRKAIGHASGYSSQSGLLEYRNIIVTEFVSAVLEAMDKWGWYGATAARERGEHYLSTSSRAHDLYRDRVATAPLYKKDESEKIIQWASSLSDEKVFGNNFLNNIRVIARDGIASMRDENMIAGMVRAYQNEVNPPQKLDLTKSAHQGNVGDKLEIDTTVHNVFTPSYADYTIYKLLDGGGNLYTWFNHGVGRLEKGEAIRIKGTVKAHSEYKGVKETILTRVKKLGA